MILLLGISFDVAASADHRSHLEVASTAAHLSTNEKREVLQSDELKQLKKSVDKIEKQLSSLTETIDALAAQSAAGKCRQSGN